MAIGYWALDQTQCKQFDCGLRMLLQNYKELEERCTDIIDIEKVIYNIYSFYYP